MGDEIAMADAVLGAVDGRPHRTFAYPCGDVTAGDSSYLDLVRRASVAARAVGGEMQRLEEVDRYKVHSVIVNGQTGSELVSLAEKARETGTLLVFLFHGVGGGHSLNVSLAAHAELLRFLKHHEAEIWIAPLAEIAGALPAR